MPRKTHTLAILAGVLIAMPVSLGAQEEDPSRLYGRVETRDGSVYEGFIRWDGNEAGWFDILHANKPIPERNRRDAECPWPGSSAMPAPWAR